NRVGVEGGGPGGGPRVALQGGAHLRKLLRQLPDAVVLPELSSLDGSRVIPILLSASRVETPRLNGRARGRGDVDVAPGRRHAKGIDASERPRVANRLVLGVYVAESSAL